MLVFGCYVPLLWTFFGENPLPVEAGSAALLGAAACRGLDRGLDPWGELGSLQVSDVAFV